jgi:PEP-CTERM motif
VFCRAVVVLQVERDRAIKLEQRKIRTLKTALLISALLASTTAAKAANVTVTDYQLNDGDGFYSATTEGYNYYTGPITLVTTDGTINVYCADLEHTIYPGTTYTYAYQSLTENGQGVALSEALSNKLGQIATIGLNAFAHGDENEAAAAEAAIWSFEYNTTSSISPGVLDDDYLSLMNATYANTGTYALALTPYGENWPLNSGASQQMIVGLSAGAVPEPSTWALMGIGFLGLAFAGFRQRKDRLATI